MLKLYIIYIVIYICIMLIIGQINFNQKIKDRFFIISSVLYNGFLGYIDIRVFNSIMYFFSNTSQASFGTKTLPEIDFIFNMLIGVCASIIAFTCLVPINTYMCNKISIKPNVYIKINVIATLVGIVIYLLILK